MENLRMIFFGNHVVIKDKKYNNLDKVFEFIVNEKKNSKKFYVRKKETELHKEYILSLDELNIHAIFSIINDNEYTEVLEKWSSNSRKFRIAKLKFIVAALTGTIATGALISQHSAIGKRVNQIKEDIEFSIENINELHAISILEDEIKGHSGYGEIEGHKQTIKEHNNSFCSLGENVKYSSMNEKIEDFCVKYNLGEQVSDYAYEKFELLYNDETKEAYEIDLKKIYKENQKVYKKN